MNRPNSKRPPGAPKGNEPTAESSRIAELEMRITFQEDQIEALHKTAYDQGMELDRVKQRLDQLVATQRLTSGDGDLGEEAPPPHY